jgi:hypothetical protein
MSTVATTDTIPAAAAAEETPIAPAKAATKRELEELIDAGSDDDFTPKVTKKKARRSKKKSDELDATGQVFAAELLPAPYYFYRDHSKEMDDDPLTPITQAGHVPCFPAKMHAILASPDLNDIVAWDSHGRSFRMLKPKQFELHILPRFFEHSKFSSFIRQANGWGFRRFLSGPNRGSYYQEYFLRSMPWLCKKMRRPKVGEKKSISLEHEPDLSIISREFPVPNNPMTREIQIVLETIKQGPRARMPVHWAAEPLPAPVAPAAAVANTNMNVPTSAMSSQGIAASASMNPFGMGAAATAPTMDLSQNSMAVSSTNAASTNPEMLNYLRSLQNKPSATATASRNAQDSSFVAGFRAASQLANGSMPMMMSRPAVPVANTAMSSQIVGQMNHQASADYMRLLQMQLAQRNLRSSSMPARQNQSTRLSLDQLQAYQAGLWNPNGSR